MDFEARLEVGRVWIGSAATHVNAYGFVLGGQIKQTWHLLRKICVYAAPIVLYWGSKV